MEENTPDQNGVRMNRVSFSNDMTEQQSQRNNSVVSTRNSSTSPLYSSKQLLKQSMFEKYTSCRWLVAFSCFITVTCSIMLRQCISMVVVCMESNYNTGSDVMINQSNTTRNGTFTQAQRGIWDIVWDSEEKGLILQSYFYTFPITPLIGGYLSGRFSGKTVVTVMTICLIILSAVAPIAATVSTYLVVVLRCCIGLSSGGLQPSVTAIVSKWAPVSERAQIVAVANAGLMIGSIITFAFSGFICSIPIHNGWPFIFYVFCICNVMSLMMWMCLVYDRPDEHPRVTWKERALINYKRRDSTLEKMPSPPWVKILTSGPFWGLLFAHMSHAFLFTTIGTFLPLYMADVLKFDIATNGLLSSLPFIGRFIASVGSGMLADNLMTRELLSVTAARKIFHASGMLLSTPFLIWMSYMGPEERTSAVVLLVTYWTVQSLNNSGFRVNHIDIAPRFAGVLNGMTTTLASVAALLSPIITSELTKTGTQEEWQTVFFICTGVGLAGALAFVFLGSGVEQEWARDPNMNVDFDIYTTDERKSIDKAQATDGRKESQIENDINDGINFDVDNRNGHVNKGFDEQVNEIIEHVKLSSSFRSQSRDLNVPIRTSVDPLSEMTREQIESDTDLDQKTVSNGLNDIAAHNYIDVNGPHDTNRGSNLNAIQNGISGDGKEVSTFLQRTRHLRENLRLILPNHNEHAPSNPQENAESITDHFSTHL